MEPIVRFESVAVHLGGRPVLQDVGFEIAAGQVLGVAGPNGSGKTTLIRTAASLLSPERGRVESPPRTEIGLIGHQPALIPELTLEENLTHLARLRGIGANRVARALDVVGLGAASDRRASASSFGMKRRVEIAHMLLAKPVLLLLDEAASGLDEDARQLIDAILVSVRERDGAALVVSHDPLHLDGWCDDLASIAAGSIEVRP